MLVFWSAKGGSGTTVVTALSGLLAAKSGRQTVIASMNSDLATVLSVEMNSGPGLTDWFGSDPEVRADALKSFLLPVVHNLSLIHVGNSHQEVTYRRGLGELSTSLIVDAGTLNDFSPMQELAEEAFCSIAVVRPCFVAVKRMSQSKVRRDGIVLIQEPKRVLDHRDIEDILGVPVLAKLPLDPSIARSVDAGRLTSRIPSMARSLNSVLEMCWRESII